MEIIWLTREDLYNNVNRLLRKKEFSQGPNLNKELEANNDYRKKEI